jgi:autotransporter-associated beta strand protein
MVTAGTSGTIGLTTLASGDILVQAVVSSTSGAITATSAGAINESGGKFGTTDTLTTNSATGEMLIGLNAVGTFHAGNSGSGDVSLMNSASPLTITQIMESGTGNVMVSNTGDITTTGAITTVANGNISLTSSGAESIGAVVSAGGGSGSVELTANGGSITEAGAGTITGALLLTISAGGTNLTNINAVGTFNASNTTSGNIAFKNSTPTLTSTGISEVSGGQVSVNNTTGNIAVSGAVVASNGKVGLEAQGSITQIAVITTGSLGAVNTSTSLGDIVLNSSNQVGTFAGSNSNPGGQVTFISAFSSGLTIGSVSGFDVFDGVTGVTSTGGNSPHTGNITLAATGTNGTLTVAAPVSSDGAGSQSHTGGTVTIFSGVIMASSFKAGAGDVTLEGVGTDIIVASNTTFNKSTTLTANRDILIYAALTTTSGFIALNAGTGGNGVGAGGVWIESLAAGGQGNGSVNASDALTINGKDVFSDNSDPAGIPADAIRIDGSITAGGAISLNTSLGAPVGAATWLHGTLQSTAGTVTLNNAAYLTGASVVNTSGQALAFNSTIDGAKGLTLNSEATGSTAGDITVMGNVGGSTPLSSLMVSNANNLTFSGTVNTTGNVTQSFGTGLTMLGGGSIGGSVSLTTANITLNDALNVTGNTSLTVTGTATINGAIVSGTSSTPTTVTLTGGTFSLANSNCFRSGFNDVVLAGSSTILALNDNRQTFGSLASASGTSSVQLLGSAILTTGGDNANTTFAGSITGSGSLVKIGTGTLTLSGSNTYSGGTTIDKGTLAGGALGSGTVTLGGGILSLGAPAGVVLVNTVNLTADSSLVVPVGSATLFGPVHGNGNTLSKIGAGTLTLAGTADNDSLNISANAGTLVLAKDPSSGSPSVHAVGAVLTINSGVTVQLGGTGGDQIADTGTVTVNSGGVFDLDGNSETVQTLSLQGGIVQGAGMLSATTSYDLQSGTASADLGGSASAIKTTGGTVTLSGANTYSGGTTISGGTLQVGGGGTTGSLGSGAVTDDTSLIFNLSAAFTVANDIAGKGTLTQAGNGTLTLSGNNSYRGGTFIDSSTLQVGSLAAVPAASDVTVNVGCTLDLNGFPTSIGTLSGTGLVTNDNNLFAATLSLGGDDSSSTFLGAIRDGIGLVGGSPPLIALNKIGAGILTLSGNNSYSGSTVVSTGTLRVGSSRALPATSDVIVDGTLDLDGLSNTIGALSGSGIVTDSVRMASTLTLVVGATNSSGVFAGGIQNGSGTVALTKIGTGTEILSGTSTYSGATTVSAGTLEVDGKVSSDVAVVGGTLGGKGAVVGSVTVNSGGTINPGAVGAVGTLTVGSLSFNGGTYQADLDPSAGIADEISTAGSIKLANPAAGVFRLGILNAIAPAPGKVFDFIKNDGSSPVSNASLINAAEGSSTTINGSTAYYTYAGGNGKSFTLTVAGAPSITLTAAATYTLQLVATTGHGEVIERLQGTKVVDSLPTSSITGTYTITNGSGQPVTLVINYGASGGFFTVPIAYHGGTGRNDALTVEGGKFDKATETFTSTGPGNSGMLVYDPTGTGTRTDTINYDGLGSVDMSGSTIANLVFNVPAGSGPMLEAAGTTSNGSPRSRITSSTATFATTTFSNPTNSLTIATYGGSTFVLFFSQSLGGSFLADLNTTADDRIEFAADMLLAISRLPNTTAGVLLSAPISNVAGQAPAQATSAVTLSDDTGEFRSVTTPTDTLVLPTERDIAKDMNAAGSLTARVKPQANLVPQPDDPTTGGVGALQPGNTGGAASEKPQADTPAANANDMRRYLLNPIEQTPLGPPSTPDRARSPTDLSAERPRPLSQISSPRHGDSDPPDRRPLPSAQESHAERKSPFLALAMAIALTAFAPPMERRRNQYRRSRREHRSSRDRRTYGGRTSLLSFPESPGSSYLGDVIPTAIAAPADAGEFPSVTTPSDTRVLPTERDISKVANVAGSLTARVKPQADTPAANMNDVRRHLPATRKPHAGRRSHFLALAVALALTVYAPLAVFVGLATADWLTADGDRASSVRSANGAVTQAASPVAKRASRPVRPPSIIEPPQSKDQPSPPRRDP